MSGMGMTVGGGPAREWGSWREMVRALYVEGSSGATFPERRRAAGEALARAEGDPEYEAGVDAAWRLGGLVALWRLWGIA